MLAVLIDFSVKAVIKTTKQIVLYEHKISTDAFHVEKEEITLLAQVNYNN